MQTVHNEIYLRRARTPLAVVIGLGRREPLMPHAREVRSVRRIINFL